MPFSTTGRRIALFCALLFLPIIAYADLAREVREGEERVAAAPKDKNDRFRLGELYLEVAQEAGDASDLVRAHEYEVKALREFLAAYDLGYGKGMLERPLSSPIPSIVNGPVPLTTETLALLYRAKDALLDIGDRRREPGIGNRLFVMDMIVGMLRDEPDPAHRTGLYEEIHTLAGAIVDRLDTLPPQEDIFVKAHAERWQLIACLRELDEARDPTLREKRLTLGRRLYDSRHFPVSSDTIAWEADLKLAQAWTMKDPSRRSVFLTEIKTEFQEAGPEVAQVLALMYGPAGIIEAKIAAFDGSVEDAVRHLRTRWSETESSPQKEWTGMIRTTWVGQLGRGVYFDPIRDTPEFQAFLKELKGEN